MAITAVDVGAAPNDGSGDTLRSAFIKLNANDSELNSTKATLDANSLLADRHQDAPERAAGRGLIPRPNLQRITDFGTYDFVTRSPALAVVAGSDGQFDTVDFESSDRSYRFDLVNGVPQTLVLALAAPIDLRQRTLRFRMAADPTLDVGVLTQGRVRLGTESTVATFWETGMTLSTPDIFPIAGEQGWFWRDVPLPTDMTKSGLTNDEALTRITHIELTFTASTTVSVWLDRLLVFDTINRAGQGAVSIRFDDGFFNQYEAAALLEKYGYKGNFNFAWEWLDDGDAEDPEGVRNRMSTAEARDLMQRGHELSVHGTLPHTAFPTYDQLYDELYANKNALLKRGLVTRGIDFYVHPNNVSVPPWTEQAESRLFKWGANGGAGLDDEYNIPTVHLLTTWDDDVNFRQNTLDALAAGQYLIFMTHQVKDTGGDITPAKFESFLQYLADNNIQVRPTVELLENYYPALPTPDTEELLVIELSATQALSATTNTTVQFDNVIVDTLGGWDPVAFDFNPAFGGYYEVTARLGFAGQTSGETRINVWRSGAPIPGGTPGQGFLIRDHQIGTDDLWITGTAVVEVRRAVTDALRLNAWSSNAQNLVAGSQLTIRRVALGEWA